MIVENCAVSVRVSTVPTQGTGAGPSPSTALHAIMVFAQFPSRSQDATGTPSLSPFPARGTKLAFGVFLGDRLLGAMTFGAGPQNAHSLVQGACPDHCLAFTRLWLSDELPTNSESKVIGIAIRAIKRNTSVKFLVAYSDPAQGHLGTIYQATNWLYTGLSDAMALVDIGEGPKHSRTLGFKYGTHSCSYFAAHGVDAKIVPQMPKHRYMYFLDPVVEIPAQAGDPAVSEEGENMKVIEIVLGKLREAPWNANQMDEAMLERLKESLRRYGLVGPLVVRPIGQYYEVLSGNQRLRAIKELKFKSAPCVIVNLNDAEAMLLAQALNGIKGEDDLGLKGAMLKKILARYTGGEGTVVTSGNG